MTIKEGDFGIVEQGELQTETWNLECNNKGKVEGH